MPKALITGITGQNGSYPAEFLNGKGYEVDGLKRRSSSFNTERVDHLYVDFHDSGAKFFLHYADLNDASSLAGPLADILFNHESPRRGGTFVTRKITRAVARIKLGLQEKPNRSGNSPKLRSRMPGWTGKIAS